MDDIFEFLYELIIEGAMGAVKDKELPLAIRVVAGLVLTVIYGGLLVLLFVVAGEILRDGEREGLIFVALLAVVLIIPVICIIKKPKKDNE